MLVAVGIGQGSGGPLREQAERALARLLDGQAVPAFVLLIDPGARQLEIVTSGPARRRLTDQQCGLAALSMTTSFGVGDLVGGIVNGIRMLADSAGVHDPHGAGAGSGAPELEPAGADAPPVPATSQLGSPRATPAH